MASPLPSVKGNNNHRERPSVEWVRKVFKDEKDEEKRKRKMGGDKQNMRYNLGGMGHSR